MQFYHILTMLEALSSNMEILFTFLWIEVFPDVAKELPTYPPPQIK